MVQWSRTQDCLIRSVAARSLIGWWPLPIVCNGLMTCWLAGGDADKMAAGDVTGSGSVLNSGRSSDHGGTSAEDVTMSARAVQIGS
ncbi:unnamed protein product [Danaus chrysippus]|uniref:(African queen) hypothetical protein n=1 Tax=Danaus chrysippus TaxID=151541 RepID=A0A8J2QVM5_9NEOP|nr:unnamed protein product [Danaus chrysippus]